MNLQTAQQNEPDFIGFYLASQIFKRNPSSTKTPPAAAISSPQPDPQESYIDGIITWKQRQAKVRQMLEVSIEILKSIDMPGQTHGIRYLEATD